MKKKIWAAALICIVVLGMLDGCGPKEKDTDKEAAGNTETEAVEGLHATETETEAQGNLKEDTWYVLSGMYQHKMETEENTLSLIHICIIIPFWRCPKHYITNRISFHHRIK